MSTPVEELEQRRSVLQEEFARLGDFRLGSLIYRYRRCGKPGCRCSDPGHLGHGGWIISKKVRGTTVLSTVPHEEQLPLVRQQLEEGCRNYCSAGKSKDVAWIDTFEMRMERYQSAAQICQ